MSEPLPCPFCGNKPETHRGVPDSLVGCYNNGCSALASASAPTLEQAIERWNTRAPVRGSMDARIAKLDPDVRGQVLNDIDALLYLQDSETSAPRSSQ